MAGEALSTKDVAHELGCSDRWVCELIKRGELPAQRIGKRTYIVDRDALRRFMARREQAERDKPQV